MRLLAAAVAVALLLQPHSVWANNSAEDYGVADITPTDQETAEAQRYGGFPNNRDFNNDTRCKAVTTLFSMPGMNPHHPKMQAFLSYSRVSLMILDVAFDAMTKEGTAIEAVGAREWKTLPALIPAYCRQHPGAKLEDALQGAYRAVRITHSLPVP